MINSMQVFIRQPEQTQEIVNTKTVKCICYNFRALIELLGLYSLKRYALYSNSCWRDRNTMHISLVNRVPGENLIPSCCNIYHNVATADARRVPCSYNYIIMFPKDPFWISTVYEFWTIDIHFWYQQTLALRRIESLFASYGWSFDGISNIAGIVWL